MNFMPAAMNLSVAEVPENRYFVVHPLDDVEEQKVDTSTMGPMLMTTSVKLSLIALRGYLALMVLLVVYHVMDLAGVFGKH
jgi:hypothetical protein